MNISDDRYEPPFQIPSPYELFAMVMSFELRFPRQTARNLNGRRIQDVFWLSLFGVFLMCVTPFVSFFYGNQLNRGSEEESRSNPTVKRTLEFCDDVDQWVSKTWKSMSGKNR